MKRILLGTSVLVSSVLAASAAQASDPVKLSLGGYMEYWVAGASQDGKYAAPVNSFDVQGDSRIYFSGKTLLDNGMEVGAQVEIAAGADNNPTEVVRSYAWLSGAYGKAIVGKYRDVVWLTHNAPPEASYLDAGLTKSDTYQFLPWGNVAVLDPNETPTNYANKFSYLTPKLYGFQLGVSFTPSNDARGDDANATSETIAKAAGFDEAWAAALSYGTEISGVGIQAAVGYDYMNGNGDNGTEGSVHNLQTSGKLSYQGFSFGGSFNRMVAPQDSFYSAKDGHAWDLGVGYAEGPYAVSFNYGHSAVRGADVTGGVNTATLTGSGDSVDLYRVSAKYALGPGVDLWSSVAYLNSESRTGDAAKGNEGAIGGALGLRLTF